MGVETVRAVPVNDAGRIAAAVRYLDMHPAEREWWVSLLSPYVAGGPRLDVDQLAGVVEQALELRKNAVGEDVRELPADSVIYLLVGGDSNEQFAMGGAVRTRLLQPWMQDRAAAGEAAADFLRAVGNVPPMPAPETYAGVAAPAQRAMPGTPGPATPSAVPAAVAAARTPDRPRVR